MADPLPNQSPSDADPPSRLEGQPRSGGATLEDAARALLPVKELAEARRLTVQLACSFLGAESAAVYAQQGDEFLLQASWPAGEANTPSIPSEAVRSLRGGPGEPVPVSSVRGTLGPWVDSDGIVARVDAGDRLRLLYLIGRRVGGGGYGHADLARFARLLELFRASLRNAELFDRLRSQVFIDFLTECYNRRAFEEHLRIEWVRARRYERPVALLLLDIDHFKRINDGLGHLAGDHALQRIGAVLRHTFRTTDRVCRYGGDEFAVIFPETSKEEVLRLAERIRHQVSSLFPDGAVARPVTASVGVAAYPEDGSEPEEVLQAADLALYAAKTRGRNLVVAAPS